jgi:hypothetical protein
MDRLAGMRGRDTQNVPDLDAALAARVHVPRRVRDGHGAHDLAVG